MISPKFIPPRLFMNHPDYLGGGENTDLGMDIIPSIQQEDIDKRVIYRYFARRSNDVLAEIIEIEENKYNTIQSIPLYVAVRVPWRIAGKIEDIVPTYVGVKTANEKAVQEAEKKVPGIVRKLTNPLQYYQR